MSVFSVTCGTRQCNANCPFCISKMTEACNDKLEFNHRRFRKAMQYAAAERVPTALVSGRGEPTLYPTLLSNIIFALNKFFPCIELQTNGVLYKDLPWSEYESQGLNTIAISVASANDKINNEIMRIKNKTFEVSEAIAYLAKMGFTIRISAQLTNHLIDMDGYLCDEFESLIKLYKALGAQQVTFRFVGAPDDPRHIKAAEWVNKYAWPKFMYGRIKHSMSILGKKIATYHWGGMMYDIEGMSVCIADCLTENPEEFNPRTYIFDGKNLRYSWQHEGAIIF